MALRYHGHHHGGGFLRTIAPSPSATTHPAIASIETTHSSNTATFLHRQHSNRSTGGPSDTLKRLGSGTPIDENAYAPSTPTTAQPSRDGWRKERSPRVIGFWGERFGLGEYPDRQPRINLIPWRRFGSPPGEHDLALLGIIQSTSIFRADSIKQYHFQGWKLHKTLDRLVCLHCMARV